MSNAFWPAQARRHVSTARVAQQRRRVIIASSGWLSTLSLRYKRVNTLLSQHQSLRLGAQAALIILCSCVAFALSNLYGWSVVLSYWSLLLMLALFCVLTTLLITHLILDERGKTKPSTHTLLPVQPVRRRRSVPPRPALPISEVGSLTAIPPSRLKSLFSFPDTPVPVPPTPLVRVLETIDLSSSNVEHFIDGRPSSHIPVVRRDDRHYTPSP